MGQQSWTWATSLNRAGRHRSLLYGLTTRAGSAGPDDLVYNEPAGHIFQLFDDIFTKNLEIIYGRDVVYRLNQGGTA